MFSLFKKQRTQNQKLDEISKKIAINFEDLFDLVDETSKNLKEAGVPLEKEPAMKFLFNFFDQSVGPQFKSTDTVQDYIIKLWCLKYFNNEHLIVDGIAPIGHPIWNSIQRGEGVPPAFELYDEKSDSIIENSFFEWFGQPIKIPSNFILWREICTVKDANALNIYAKVQLNVTIIRKIVNQDDFYKIIDENLGW